MSDDFDREEQAFRDAFRRELEGESFRPLDPDEIRTTVGPVRRLSGPWAKGLAAAAAVVLVVGGAGIVLPRLLGSGSTASGSMAAAPGPEAAGGIAVNDAASAESPVPSAAGSSANATKERSTGWVETAASPLSPRILASGALADGRFYVVGGRGLPSGCTGTAVECAAGTANDLLDGASYDPSSDTWQPLPDAPVAVSQQAPAVVGLRLYYVAEGTADQPQRVVVFDTATSAWASVDSPGNGGDLVAAGDRLVSVSADSSEPDRLFDPASGTWSDLPADLWKDVTGRSGTWADGRLVVAASPTGSSGRVRVETLDLESGTWRELAEGKAPLTGVVAVGDYVLVGDPGAFGGGEAASLAVGGRIDVRTGEWRKWSVPEGSLDASWGQTVVGDRLVTRGLFYDPAHDTWTGLVLPGSRSLFAPTVAGSPDGLLVFGGADGRALSGDAYYLPIP